MERVRVYLDVHVWLVHLSPLFVNFFFKVFNFVEKKGGKVGLLVSISLMDIVQLFSLRNKISILHAGFGGTGKLQRQ